MANFAKALLILVLCICSFPLSTRAQSQLPPQKQISSDAFIVELQNQANATSDGFLSIKNFEVQGLVDLSRLIVKDNSSFLPNIKNADFRNITFKDGITTVGTDTAVMEIVEPDT